MNTVFAMTITNKKKTTRRGREHGSALLIVFVMAAMVAVLLYKEMPVSAFEAQRQKEELLVDRGGEYKRAIRLYVRKFGRFPGSMAELESTNRMRFLRRKYVDPLTGKDDWRILHAGPGGVILDSKVNTTKNNTNASTLGQGATFAGFNNSIVQPLDGDSALAGVPSAALRQRPSATTNAASVNGGSGVAGQFPPLPTGGEVTPVVGVGDAQNLYPGASPMGAPNASQNLGPTSSPLAAGNGPNGTTTLANDPSVVAAVAAAGVGGIPQGNGAVMQQLNNPNPSQPQSLPPPGGQPPTGLQNTSSFPQAGQQQNQQLQGGGIAGVASIAVGKSIRTVNDQTKYSLWEFYYDLRKEQTANVPGGGGLQQNPLNPGQNPSQNGNNSSTSGFNSGSSGFGNQSSAFGQQTGPGAPAQGAPAQGTPPTPPE